MQTNRDFPPINLVTRNYGNVRVSYQIQQDTKYISDINRKTVVISNMDRVCKT